ncbi:type II toxin-antitoxin system RelE/ParE family toxin [Actinomyces viscosus]|uniref:Addiction module toxin component, YafQ family n=1 Tax=Actinomyces viscosus TaxID=1656 RepID=A0A3S4X7B4_ACTVI|nr:type II toxin-antitoxin system mRNA interferase toxin, RelE/StbE family [Actinomyces viscosus]VEI14243.1 addiction module toxin component, YafQ family [Actinomyces viscosus]
MLEIVISNKCKKDLKRAKKRGLDLSAFFAVVEMLQRQETLPARYRDHALTADRPCRQARDGHRFSAKKGPTIR